MQKMITCLWFDGNAEEAVAFYTSVFHNSRIVNVARYSKAVAEGSGMPEGSVMLISFELEGQEFAALNGGPGMTFTPAISILVNCRTQEEIDHLWERLSDGGTVIDCGWVTDRYGVTWQIASAELIEMLRGSESASARTDRVMQAMMRMKKMDLATLRKAAAD